MEATTANSVNAPTTAANQEEIKTGGKKSQLIGYRVVGREGECEGTDTRC